MNKTSRKYAIYDRVSTDKQQLEKGIESCKKYCAFKDINDYDIYTDIGSGKAFFNRPNLTLLIKRLRNYEYKGIILFRLDRFGRTARECSMLFEELENKGIEIHSVNENLDTSTAMGRAFREIILIFAQLERENISEATKQRLDSLKALGKKLGRPKGSKDDPKKPRKKSGYYGNKNRSKKGGVKNRAK